MNHMQATMLVSPAGKGIMAEDAISKLFASAEYNFKFIKETGFFARWGKTKEHDPVFSPFGPEILDLEISTICHGPKNAKGKNQVCSFCYKGNTGKGTKMSFETFKVIFDKMPKTLTQIAFGIGDMPETADDDMWMMFEYAKERGVIPNLTFNGYGLNDINVPLLAKYCGGIAVSHYYSTHDCFEAIRTLSDAGVKQVNIHKVLSAESYAECLALVDQVADSGIAKEHLKAIVFLTLKPKGSRNTHNIIKDVKKYKDLIEHANDRNVQIGMDSCSAKMYLMAMKQHPNFHKFSEMVESCESTLFSSYINVNGDFFPCSFTEDEAGWETGVSVVEAEDFIKDVWYNERVIGFRNKNIGTTDTSVCGDCRSCVTFPVIDPANWTKTAKVIPIMVAA
jgi:MoaA/NifB/PqqE/SkfB family radical SAM enzyme